MKKLITGLFAIAAFTVSASAQTQDNSDGQRRWDRDNVGQHQGRGDRGMRGMENLNLTDAQKQQIKSINEDFRTKMQALNQNGNITVNDSRAQRQQLMQDRKNKISAILTPEQKTKFEQMIANRGEFGGRNDRQDGDRSDRMGSMGGERMRGGEGRIEELKTQLNLTDDQVAKIKAGSESFRQRAQAIRENQSLTDDQRKQQMETLRKEREANLKSYLTADQIAKFDQLRGNNGDWKNKTKGDGWKEKRKSEDGKEKVKVKTT